jgi:hypothetical protein
LSTILEALSERDAPGTSVLLRQERTWAHRRRLAAVLVVSMLAVTLLIGRSMSPDQPAAAVAVAPPSVEPFAPTPVRPFARDGDEPPRARVEKPWTPARSSPRQPAPPAAGTPAAATSPPEPVTAELAAERPAAEPLPSAEPSLSLQSVWYSDDAGQRTVTLSIDGHAPVRLRQGDVKSGVEVQLILPEAVYVRRGGDVFALGDVR